MEQENNGQLNQIANALNDIAASMKRDPQEERYHSETHCPSCGRFVGTETRCPYCQTETQKRLSIRIFKYISVLISTLGLLMLLFYARNVKTPAVSIKELGPLSNFAHVKIIGYASQNANITPWGTLSFYVYQYVDKNGKVVTDKNLFESSERVEMKVTAYKKVAQGINKENLPSRGDLIDVEGQIRVQQQEASMLINSSEHLRLISKADPNSIQAQNNSFKSGKMDAVLNSKPLTPQAITANMKKKTVKVSGLVKQVQQVENDCVIIRLENGTEKGLPVFVPQFTKNKLSMPKIGATLESVGTVEEYYGELEVKVFDGSTFKIIPNKNN